MTLELDGQKVALTGGKRELDRTTAIPTRALVSAADAAKRQR